MGIFIPFCSSENRGPDNLSHSPKAKGEVSGGARTVSPKSALFTPIPSAPTPQDSLGNALAVSRPGPLFGDPIAHPLPAPTLAIISSEQPSWIRCLEGLHPPLQCMALCSSSKHFSPVNPWAPQQGQATLLSDDQLRVPLQVHSRCLMNV